MWTDLAYAMGQTPGGGQGSQIWSFLPIILIFVIFYFLLIRPQQKQKKEHQSLLHKSDQERIKNVCATGDVIEEP